MDLEITSKLLKYSPSDVQSVTYVVEYAEHNYEGEARDAYLAKRLVTPTEKAIAEVIIEGKKGLWANIHAKRKRGEAPAKKGDKDYPKTLNIEHHQKDANGKVIEHDDEAPGTPASVEEQKAPRMQKGAMAYDGPNKAASEARDRILAKTKALRAKAKAKTQSEALEMTKKEYDKIHKDFKSDDPKNPRTTKYVPGKGTVSMPVKFKEQVSANAATLNMKPSAASPKIDTPKEKESTTDPCCDNQRTIKAKGVTPKTQVEEQKGKGSLKQARKNVGASTCWDGYVAKGTKMKNGKQVPNCVKESEEWVWDVVDELGDEFDNLTEQDLQDVVVEALLDFDTQENLFEAIDIIDDGCELLTEAPSKDSAFPNVAVQAPRGGSKPTRASRVDRLKSAAKKAGGVVRKGLAKAGSAAKAGAKAGAKGAVRGAGYASGLAQRAASSAKSEFSKGRERGLRGSSSGGSSSGSSSSGGGSSSGGSSSGGSSGGGGSYSGGSSSGSSSSSGTSGGTQKKSGPSLLSRAAGAVGRGLKRAVKGGANLAKKAVGKTSRAISKGSDKLARKLGESMAESKTDKVRRILKLQQETLEHDRAHAKDASAAGWRERLAYTKFVMEEPSAEQLKKREVLKQTKELTNKGKHKEASEMFKKHFPNFGK
tara:strand:- start:5786 stop:7741 length:1956 start_codon:yes stop_codon:yes gene_type:complete